eukprot:jgi/Botrbrau1/2087/Bobra.0047s0047.3
MTDSGLSDYVDRNVSVVTNDGRNIVGMLKGCDQASNLVLGDCHERVYSTKAGVEQVALGGFHVIRGDNIAIVGELDDDVDTRLDFSNIRAAPLRPVIH